MSNNFFVYVLSNQAGRIYIGQTDDLNRRLTEHNSREHNIRKYTSRHKGPWRLVHSESYIIRTDAIKRETYLKSRSGRRWLRTNIL